jgi:hypothetical protein
LKKPLSPLPRLGLIDDISAGTYPTFLSQVREAVSNARDAGASECKISYNAGIPKSIAISDNGDGMTEDELEKELLAVGGSAKKGSADDIGTIGIGFYALTSSCEALEIITKKKSASTPIRAQINCKYIHDIKNHRIEMSEATIGQWLTTNPTSLDTQSSTDSYTIIRLINPNQDVTSHFTEVKKLEELKRELCIVLPIEYDWNSPIFTKHPELMSAYKKLTLRCINVFFNGQQLKRLIYGDEGSQEFNGKFEFIDRQISKLRFVGFSYTAPEKQITPADIRGFVIRLKNVAIGKQTFLGFSGQGIEARGKRITGEIHLAEFPKGVVLIGREGFRSNNIQYKELEKFIHGLIEENISVVDETYGVPKQTKQVVEAPAKIHTAMQKSIDLVKNEKSMKGTVTRNAVVTLKAAPDLTLRDYEKIINLPVVYRTPDPAKKKKSFAVELSGSKRPKPKIVIYDKNFFEKDIEFKIGDKIFSVVFKKTGAKETPIEIDYAESKVYINKSASVFKNEGSFLNAKTVMLIFWIKYLYDHSSSKEDYYSRLIAMLPKLLLKN